MSRPSRAICSAIERAIPVAERASANQFCEETVAQVIPICWYVEAQGYAAVIAVSCRVEAHLRLRELSVDIRVMRARAMVDVVRRRCH